MRHSEYWFSSIKFVGLNIYTLAFLTSNIYITFTFMHLADASVQSDLQGKKNISLTGVIVQISCEFSYYSTHKTLKS